MANHDGRKLNIVDESDKIVGIKDRTEIHQKGLLHREVHVWFYTPKGGIIFQHRAKDKDTYPDLLDATVGGHVEIDTDYLQTAIKETEEETGIQLRDSDLIFLKKILKRSEDAVTHTINNAFKTQYAYLFQGNIADLKIEKGKAIGFEEWPIDVILGASEEQKKKFIPIIFKQEFRDLFIQIKQLLL